MLASARRVANNLVIMLSPAFDMQYSALLMDATLADIEVIVMMQG
jgi:hypothetical protein